MTESNSNSNNVPNRTSTTSIPSATHLVTKPLTNSNQSSVDTSSALTKMAFDSLHNSPNKK